MSVKNLKDLTGRRFGRWEVLERLEPRMGWTLEQALTVNPSKSSLIRERT